MSNNKSDFVPPDGGYGWIIVLSTTLINICALPIIQNFGIIYRDDFESMGTKATKTSFLLHLHSAIYCSLGLLGSPLLKKFTFRQVALCGTFLMSCGIFLSSFAKSYTVLICTFSVLIGIGQGLMLPATYLATNTYFKKRLTLAISFSVTGAGITNIFMPQVCSKLLQHFQNTKDTVLVLTGISLVSIMMCCFLRPIRKKPESAPQEEETMIESKPVELKEISEDAEKVYQETTVPLAKKQTFSSNVYNLFNLELLSDFPYLITIIGMSISFASELNIILMLPFVLPELAGFSTQDVALVLSIQSVADIIGRLVVPTIFHNFSVSPKIMYAASLITSTVGRTVIANYYGFNYVIYGCACFLGLAKGTKAVYQSVIIPKYVNLERLPAANGLNMFLSAIASLVIGLIIGVIHDLTKSYVYALHAGSLLSMFCVVLWLLYYLIVERRTKKIAEGEITIKS